MLTLQKPKQATGRLPGRGLAAADARWALNEATQSVATPQVSEVRDAQGRLERYDCGAGYYYHFWRRKCRPCKDGCLECTSRKKCNKCVDDTMWIQKGKCNCPAGELQDDMTCGGCPVGEYWHKWRKRCKSCGWMCNKCTKWWKCDECGNGFDNVNGQCRCLSGKYGPGFTCLSDEEEVECGEGNYRSGQWCYQCPNNCESCLDNTGECTSCKDTHFLNQWGECECNAGSHHY